MRSVALLLLAAAGWPATSPAAALRAQEGRPCVVVFRGVTRGGELVTSMRTITTAAGTRQVFVSGGVDATCEGQGNRLLADSAEHYEDRGELILINRVRYSEPRVTLQSDRMIYYTNEERLFATGNVRGRTNTGTRFNGPEMDYFRAKPGLRLQPSWRAPGRPFVRMAPQDTTPRRPPKPGEAVPSDSVDLTADVIRSVNDSLVWASGKVVIERHDMIATGDSATLDEGSGFARLLRTPKIVGRGERPFTMVGVEIDVWSREQRLERVRSSGDASVVSDSLTLVSDTIDLRFADQLMQRVFAWGGRAKADAPAQQMEADSLDIRMPGQRLLELHALGRAIAYTSVDTARIVTEERDWIAGDTIVAHFDTATVPGDTAQRTRMREVTATGAARAFYQLAPSGGGRGAPNLSYNRGREIVVSFAEGEVQQVDVKEKASGLYLEPVRSDSTAGEGKTGEKPAGRPGVPPAAGATPAARPPVKPPVKPAADPRDRPAPPSIPARP